MHSAALETMHFRDAPRSSSRRYIISPPAAPSSSSAGRRRNSCAIPGWDARERALPCEINGQKRPLRRAVEMATRRQRDCADYGVHKTTRKDTLEPSDTKFAISPAARILIGPPSSALPRASDEEKKSSPLGLPGFLAERRGQRTARTYVFYEGAPRIL